MAANRLHTHLGRLLLAACITVTGLMASEHHGIVKSGGLPVPGATVTANQGDKKVVTTTDDTGYYSFPDLEDGIWTITVEMLGFGKTSKEIGVAADAPSPQWDLKFQTLEELTVPEAAAATPAPAAAASAPTAATSTSTAATPPVEKPAETKAAAPAAATPATAAATTPASNSKNAKNAKNAKTPTPATGGTNNGRPSLNAALASQGQGGGFTRLGVNQAGDASAAGLDAAPQQDMSGSDLAAQGNQSFTINGSVSPGLDMPQTGGDWFGGGRGGMGGDMGGGMGPGGGIPGMGGMPGDPTQAAMGGDAVAGAGGGRGGRGGGDAGGGGGRGGGGGAMPMIAGGGGFGGGRGGGGFGGGGRGGFGGPGGPGGRGGRNAASFGNNRRNPRSRYNFALSANLTNSALNAQQYSVSGQTVKKPSTQNLSSTITAGGPLKIKHIIPADKATFTINYTFGRNRTGNSWQSNVVPTDAERGTLPGATGANFSGFLGANSQPVTVFDPTTGQAFPNNTIPLSRINPAATALLKYIPEPNFSGNSLYNYATAASGYTNSDNVNMRLSYTINTKNQVNGGLQYQRSNTSTPTALGFVDAGTNNGVAANASYIYHFTLRLIATTRYNYSKSTALTTPFFANKTNIEGPLGITGVDQSPLNWGPPSLSFAGGSNFMGLSDLNESYTHPQTSAVGESLLWVHNTHEFTFGGDYSRREANSLSQSNPRGSYTFNGSYTQGLVNGVTALGADFADFLLGAPTTSAIAFGNADKYLRTSVYDLFANDQWRINTRLSLQLGLRWDYQQPTTEKYNRLVNLDVAPGFTGIAAVQAGQVGSLTGRTYSDSLVTAKMNNISPRLGLAWKPFAKRSTVVRAGWGIGYSPSLYSTLASRMAQQPPLSKTFSLQNGPTCPLTILNGFASSTVQTCAANNPTNTYGIDPNLRIAYAQQWQFSVQQNLKYSLVSTLNYTGTKGTGLTQTFYPNTAPFPKNSSLAQVEAVYPYAQYVGGYQYQTSNGNSTYNSLQAQLMRRTRGGMGGNLAYTYSKGMDDSTTAQNWQNLSAERAPTAGIREHTLTATLNYSTGVGTRGGGLINGWRGVLIKDWTFMTSINLGSGAPITPTVSGSTVFANTNSANISMRPDATGQPFFLDGRLNVAAFAAPPTGQWGTMSRDFLTGPSQFTMSANANRTFRVGDRKNVTFSLRASNPLNHFVVTSWNTSFSTQNQQFGLPNTQNGYSAPRMVTANIRINF